MSKHTPGEWFTSRPNRTIYIESRIGGGMLQEVAACGPTEATEQQEANARLIAAAPELLQALTDLGDWLAYGMNKAAGAEPTAEDHAACERVAKQARAAIDKATGAA